MIAEVSACVYVIVIVNGPLPVTLLLEILNSAGDATTVPARVCVDPGAVGIV